MVGVTESPEMIAFRPGWIQVLNNVLRVSQFVSALVSSVSGSFPSSFFPQRWRTVSISSGSSSCQLGNPSQKRVSRWPALDDMSTPEPMSACTSGRCWLARPGPGLPRGHKDRGWSGLVPRGRLSVGGGGKRDGPPRGSGLSDSRRPRDRPRDGLGRDPQFHALQGLETWSHGPLWSPPGSFPRPTHGAWPWGVQCSGAESSLLHP